MRNITFMLPSKGKLPGTLAEMTLREMKVKEEKALFSSRKPFAKMKELLNHTFVSGVDGKGLSVEKIDLNNWPLVDMTHALFKLRAITIDRVYDFTVQCPVCGQAVLAGVDLEDGLETTYADENELGTYDVEISEHRLKLKHLLVKDQAVIDRLMTQRKGRQGMDYDSGYTLRMAVQVAEIDGEPVKNIIQTERWIDELASREREELDVVIEDHSFGDDLRLMIECPYCSAVEDTVMPITRDFLFRRGRSKRERGIQ